jgi:hypothetical protein
MTWWLLTLITIILIFGIPWGVIYAVVLVVGWQLVFTAVLSKGHTLRHMLKQPWLFVSAYGCYCSPKWGFNFPTGIIPPIDSLDEACLQHDKDMYNNKIPYYEGSITKYEFLRRNSRDDWKFIKSAISARSYASGIYLLGLLVGFLFRLLLFALRAPFVK